MQVENRVRELVEEKIADRPDLFIIGIQLYPNGKLNILLDGDQGVSIDTCVKVSRHVGFYLEEEDLIPHAYNLEVSSPGAETPFTHIRQYSKNIGRTVEVQLKDGQVKTGELLDIEGESILKIAAELPTKGKKIIKGRKAPTEEISVDLAEIVTTKVIISFS